MKIKNTAISKLITKEKILELWEIKLMVYALRDAAWIKKMAFAPLILAVFIVLLSKFNRNMTIVSLSISLVYIVVSFLIYKKIKLLQASADHANDAYPLVAILHSTFDLLVLFVFAFFAFLISIVNAQTMSVDLVVVRLMIVFILLIIFVSCWFSPKITASKSLAKANYREINSRLSKIVSISMLAPSFFILVSALMFNFEQVNFVQALITFLGYLGGSLLTPYVASGFFELILLSLHEYPIVKRSGSKFFL